MNLKEYLKEKGFDSKRKEIIFLKNKEGLDYLGSELEDKLKPKEMILKMKNGKLNIFHK